MPEVAQWISFVVLAVVGAWITVGTCIIAWASAAITGSWPGAVFIVPPMLIGIGILLAAAWVAPFSITFQ